MNTVAPPHNDAIRTRNGPAGTTELLSPFDVPLILADMQSPRHVWLNRSIKIVNRSIDIARTRAYRLVNQAVENG
jgi:hypothetical protein